MYGCIIESMGIPKFEDEHRDEQFTQRSLVALQLDLVDDETGVYEGGWVY